MNSRSGHRLRGLVTAVTLVAAISLLAAPAITWAQSTVVFCDSNNPPYSFGAEDGGKAQGGRVVELVDAIFDRIEGVEVEVRSLPWARCLQEARRGKVDGVLKLLYSEERAEFLRFTDPIYLSVQRLYFLRERFPQGIRWSTSSDLAPYTFGVVPGGSHGPLLDEAVAVGTLKSQEAMNDAQNWDKLLAGRVDVIADNEIMAAERIREQGAADRVGESEQEIASREVRIGLSKESTAVSLIPAINSALSELKKEGIADRIMKGKPAPSEE